MKRIVLCLFVLTFLTGCGSSKLDDYSISYYLNVTDVFSERIGIGLPKNAYDIADKEIKNLPDDAPYPLEYSLLKRDYYPIFSNKDEVYKKNIKKYKDGVDVSLLYNYPEKYFVYNNLITVCFSSYDLVSGDDYFEIILSGSFSCNNKIENLNIVIDSSHKVLESNGKKTKDGYVWNISKDDFSNVNVHYKISRKYSEMKGDADNSYDDGKRDRTIRNLRIVSFVIMLLVIGFFSVRFYFMRRESY